VQFKEGIYNVLRVRSPNIKMSSATVWNGCMASLVIWGPSADSSRLEVQQHWRLCRWSWCASNWREAYKCQPSTVFLGKLFNNICYINTISHLMLPTISNCQLSSSFLLSVTEPFRLSPPLKSGICCLTMSSQHQPST